jgi:hypothetical protein
MNRLGETGSGILIKISGRKIYCVIVFVKVQGKLN